MGISNKGTESKIITSCDNASATNIVLARDPGASEAAHLKPLAGTEINHTLWYEPYVYVCEIWLINTHVKLEY